MVIRWWRITTPAACARPPRRRPEATKAAARRSPRELTPGAERLQVGQRFMSIFTLASYAPDEHVTLRSRRTAVTYAVVVVRGRGGPAAQRPGRLSSRAGLRSG
jgi:hypothetical protein